MKNFLLILAVITASISTSCTKSLTPAPIVLPSANSKSYIEITMNGKTLVARDTMISDVLYPMVVGVTISPNDSIFTKIITINSKGLGVYYNGDIWSMNSCQYCACDYGRVICHNVQCEAKFCMNDEIMVKRKDQCCMQCRKPIYCDIDGNNKVKVS
jgi:hypothetical protein